MASIENKERRGVENEAGKSENEVRIGLAASTDMKRLMTDLWHLVGNEGTQMTHQVTSRFSVFGEQSINEKGQPEYPHVTVIEDGERSYVRPKIQNGKVPTSPHISRKFELPVIPFNPQAEGDLDRALHEGFYALNAKPGGLIQGPRYVKDKWIVQADHKGNKNELGGDTIIIDNRQIIPVYGNYAGRVLKELELELLNADGYPGKKIDKIMSGERDWITRVLNASLILPTYYAPGKSKYSEEIAMEAGLLRPLRNFNARNQNRLLRAA